MIVITIIDYNYITMINLIQTKQILADSNSDHLIHFQFFNNIIILNYS